MDMVCLMLPLRVLHGLFVFITPLKAGHKCRNESLLAHIIGIIGIQRHKPQLEVSYFPCE